MERRGRRGQGKDSVCQCNGDCHDTFAQTHGMCTPKREPCGDLVSVGTEPRFASRMVVTVAQQCDNTVCRRAVHLKVVKMVNSKLRVFYHTHKKANPVNY